MQRRLRLHFVIAALTLAATVLAVLGLNFAFRYGRPALDSHETEHLANVLDIVGHRLERESERFREDTLMLSAMPSITKYVDAAASHETIPAEELAASKERAMRVLLAFMDQKSSYLQARYIDATGMEVLRVQRARRHGPTEVVVDAKLQNKSSRPYFIESKGLEKGGVYVSQIDLNEENGRVAEPHVSTVRFATPVFTAAGTFAGVIVTSAFGDVLLDVVRTAPIPDISVIDEQGYYVLHPEKPADEFGRQLGTDIRPEPEATPTRSEWAQLMQGKTAYREEYVGPEREKYFFRRVQRDPQNIQSYFLLVYQVPEDHVFTDYDKSAADITTAYAVILAVIALLYLIAVAVVTRPLTAMSKAVEELSAGRMNVRVPIIGNGQIAAIARFLNRMVDRNYAIERGRFDFISSASHQLRTPSTALRLQLNLLREALEKIRVPAKLRQLVRQAEEQNLRTILIMNDLLRYLELGESYVVTSREAIPLRALVDETTLDLASAASAERVTIENDVPAEIVVLAAKRDLHTLLQNLIGNAVDYSKPGGTVKIHALQNTEGTTIRIEDQGIGVPRAEMSNLYEPFFRATNSYTRRTVGSGLGLSIAKRIMTGHGGTINIKSVQNEGTVVTVFFPAKA